MSASRSALWLRFRRAIVTLALVAAAVVAALASGDGMGLLDGLVYDLSLAVTDRRPGSAEQDESRRESRSAPRGGPQVAKQAH